MTLQIIICTIVLIIPRILCMSSEIGALSGTTNVDHMMHNILNKRFENLALNFIEKYNQ